MSKFRIFKWRKDGRKSIRRGLYDKLTATMIRNRLRKRGHKARVEEVPVEYPNATHYSENFKRSELDCKCGCKTPKHIQANLVRLCEKELEPLRLRLGKTVSILSGYRCPAYNKKVGGASKSKHMDGLAVDFNMKAMNGRGVSQRKMVDTLKKIRAVNGIGEYPGGAVHGDIRKPPRQTWSSF